MSIKIFRFQNVLYKGNIYYDVFKFCFKQNSSLIKIILPQIWNMILHIAHIRSEQEYIIHKWKFFFAQNNYQEISKSFAENFHRKINQFVFSELQSDDMVVDEIPHILMQDLLKGSCNIIGITYEQNQLVWKDINMNLECNIYAAYDYYNSKFLKLGKEKYIVTKNTIEVVDHHYLFIYWVKYAISLCCILFLSFIVMLLTFINATSVFNPLIFGSYFLSFKLLLFNFLPIVSMMLIVYYLSDRTWLAFAFTGYFFYILSLINKFKLRFRDDPFVWSDISLAGEAGDMAGKYDISLGLTQILVLVSIAILSYAIFVMFKRSYVSKGKRYCKALVIVLLTFGFIHIYLFNEETYNSLGDETVINKWSQSQQFQSRGFVYPFLYSYSYAVEKEPDHYDPAEAKKVLETQKYSNIPDNQKVNIISIMLESYNDLSKFEGVEFETDVYTKLHEIQNESISGNLVVNIFAGGTIATERSFLNGFLKHPDYKYNTNSFVRYFNEQGYYTQALHPSYGWFYNRRNVNSYLGFQDFLYSENHYNEDKDDDTFFPDLLKQYEIGKQRNQPYFNFSLNYQGHGPYATSDEYGIRYLKWKEGYNEEDYNNINNYLYQIANTTEHLYDLVSYLKEDEEPVILVLFGDHNPLLNNNSTGFSMLGVSLDLDTQEGFENYYEVPYVIWANDAAKNVFQKDFVGVGDTISPNYLMTYLFEYLGWKGNEYMHYLSNLKNTINVMNSTMYKINGEWKREEDENVQKLLEAYRNVEYYYSHNLMEHNKK